MAVNDLVALTDIIHDRDCFPPALVLLEKSGKKVAYSWKEYGYLAESVANRLRPKIKKGENNFFAVLPLNTPKSLFIMLGIILAGGVPVPINVALLKERGLSELRYIFDDCCPKSIFAPNCLLGDLDEDIRDKTMTFEELLSLAGCHFPGDKWHAPEKPPVFSGDFSKLIIMPYTSGTTGKPKGVMLSGLTIYDRVKAVTETLNITSEDRLFSYLSLGHISDLIASFFGPLFGSHYAVFFTERAHDLVFDREGFRPHFPEILRRVRPTIFLAVPKVWINFRKGIEEKLPSWLPSSLAGPLVRRKLGLNKTRVFISAAAKIAEEELNFFKNLGIQIQDIYGQTETAGPILLNGKPIGQTRVEIDEQGEVVMSGQGIMSGYYNQPAATKKVFAFREICETAWKTVYKTGDLGENIGTDGSPRIVIKGRIGDGFKLAQGEFVRAEQIENLENQLRRIEGIEEVVVCGENKSYLVALFFADVNLNPKEHAKLEERLKTALAEVGEGLLKVKNFEILDSRRDLLLTPTGKSKRKEMIRKFEQIIKML